MKTIKCPKCGESIIIDISRAIDENAEEYVCTKCGYIIRYAR